MKITDYPKVDDLNPLDVFLTDGVRGTKTIEVQDIIIAAMDTAFDPMYHRNLFRGKNLGTEVTEAQKEAIGSGTFKDLFVGDYWVINDVTWRIADINYWMGHRMAATAPTYFRTNHLAIIPDSTLYKAPMNATSVVTGGYYGSLMRSTNINRAIQMADQAFPNLVIEHPEFLTITTHATGGYPTVKEIKDVKVVIPNSAIIFGTRIQEPMTSINSSTGALTRPYLIDHSPTPLSLMQINNNFIPTNDGTFYWLRDTATYQSFSSVADYGANFYTGASSASIGVRPIFAIGVA